MYNDLDSTVPMKGKFVPLSSNGRTAPFEGVNLGSIPDRGTKLL